MREDLRKFWKLLYKRRFGTKLSKAGQQEAQRLGVLAKELGLDPESFPETTFKLMGKTEEAEHGTSFLYRELQNAERSRRTKIKDSQPSAETEDQCPAK